MLYKTALLSPHQMRMQFDASCKSCLAWLQTKKYRSDASVTWDSLNLHLRA